MFYAGDNLKYFGTGECIGLGQTTVLDRDCSIFSGGDSSHVKLKETSELYIS